MKYILRIILGALFCVSAISKLSSIESFELYLFSFQLFSYDLCSLSARLLIVAELLLGLGLVSCIWRKFLNWTCAGFLAAFSAFLVWRIAVGDTGSCHCFGDLVDMNPWQSLLKNFVFGGLLALGWKVQEPKIFKSLKIKFIVSVISSLAVLFVVFAFWPPALWWRLIGHESKDVVEELWKPYSDELNLSEGKQVVLFVSPLCEHCQKLIARVKAMVDVHKLPVERFHEVFMIVSQDPDDMPKLVYYFYNQAGIEDPGFSCNYIPADDFLPMTNGSMPEICLFQDGHLVKEFNKSTLEESALVDFLK